MSKSLRTLSRVKSLAEELRRVELARASRRLAEIEERHSEAGRRALALREAVFTVPAEGDAPSSMQTLSAVEWQLAVSSAERLKARLPAAERTVAEARSHFMEERRERRQIETLLDAQTEEARLMEQRAGQRLLDSWFQSRMSQAGSRDKRLEDKEQASRARGSMADGPPGNSRDE